MYGSVYVSTPVSQFIHPPSNHMSVIYIRNYFCFVNKFICSHFLDCTYKRYHMVFVFLCLTYFTEYDNL